VLHQAGSSSLDGVSYAYDAAGNRTSKTALPSNVTSAYSYDPTYQLTQVLQGTAKTEAYTYDPVGNRTYQPGAPYTYNASNEMLTREGVPYTYDGNGNRLNKMNGSGTTSYAWDFENRLTSVTLPGTAGTVSFKYDPFGRRINKSSPSGSTTYVYDGDNIIEELTGSTGTLGERYTYGPGIDEPLVGQRQPKIFYYEADGLGSVTSLTDPTGAVAATYTYDSFGFMTNSTGSATNWFRYTVRQFDSDTGLYYYRARYYDPQSGRFLSEDPIGISGGINFYMYVSNNPANLIDPSGLCDQDKTKNCIVRALAALFPGVYTTVGDPSGPPNPNGAHWNFQVQLKFPSIDSANTFLSDNNSQGQAGFKPFTRYASGNKGSIGTTLHLEQLNNSQNEAVNSNGTVTLAGKAHLDLYDPDTGLAGMIGHGIIDGLIGHIADLLKRNIDPGNCPW